MRARLSKPLRVASLAFALAAAVVPAAQAQDGEFVPGYTDFPNALRIESGAPGGVRFAPGHSDFPNHLRVESVYDRARAISAADEQVVVISAPEVPSFDWTDAGIGAGGALGVLLLAVGVAAIAVRRPTRKTALSG